MDAAQAYLNQWETRWADTRIHGTTKRHVSAMFAEERPHLQPLPLENDELQRRQDRLLERRRVQARLRDPSRSLDGFDFTFTKKMNRALLVELATGRFISQHEDILLAWSN